MAERCGAIATAGKSNAHLPGWATSADCSFATTIICTSIKPFSISPASSLLSDTYETTSKQLLKVGRDYWRADGYRRELQLVRTLAPPLKLLVNTMARESRITKQKLFGKKSA